MPLPAHIRLERWCYPMGRPPVPTAEDKALAAIQVAEDFAGQSDFVRQKALKDYAIANMLKRQVETYRHHQPEPELVSKRRAA